jgi:hypothetical protein
LGLAEGVESALAVIGTGWAPIWAMGSAGAMARFPVLPGIEALTIFADTDEVGLKAARTVGQRWANAGREALVLKPPVVGADFNDLRPT